MKETFMTASQVAELLGYRYTESYLAKKGLKSCSQEVNGVSKPIIYRTKDVKKFLKIDGIRDVKKAELTTLEKEIVRLKLEQRLSTHEIINRTKRSKSHICHTFENAMIKIYGQYRKIK